MLNIEGEKGSCVEFEVFNGAWVFGLDDWTTGGPGLADAGWLL